jgi:hypothetical protein
MHVLQAKTSKIMHRRDFSVLTKDLPAKAEYVVYIRLSAVQRKMYVTPSCQHALILCGATVVALRAHLNSC